MVSMATALPVKFEPTIKRALGFVPPREDERFIGLEQRATNGFVKLGLSAQAIKQYIREQRPTMFA